MLDDETFRFENEQFRIMQLSFKTACADEHAEVCGYAMGYGQIVGHGPCYATCVPCACFVIIMLIA